VRDRLAEIPLEREALEGAELEQLLEESESDRAPAVR
jgi:hypothetical protein